MTTTTSETNPLAEPVVPTEAAVSAHGELACDDTEAILADVSAENARLVAENADLRRRLEIAIGRKNIAIDEAVAHRSRI